MTFLSSKVNDDPSIQIIYFQPKQIYSMEGEVGLQLLIDYKRISHLAFGKAVLCHCWLVRVSLFIELGCPRDLGTGPWHFYDK